MSRKSFRERFDERISSLPKRHGKAVLTLLHQVEFVVDVMESWIPLLPESEHAVATSILNALSRSHPKLKEFYRHDE